MIESSDGMTAYGCADGIGSYCIGYGTGDYNNSGSGSSEDDGIGWGEGAGWGFEDCSSGYMMDDSAVCGRVWYRDRDRKSLIERIEANEISTRNRI